MIERGFIPKFSASKPPSFCWDSSNPTLAYKNEYNCGSWCIETDSTQTFQIDLEEIYSINKVVLMTTQQANVTINMTVSFGVNNTVFVQEPTSHWLKVCIGIGEHFKFSMVACLQRHHAFGSLQC